MGWADGQRPNGAPMLANYRINSKNQPILGMITLGTIYISGDLK
jgi:hypothetical protein